MTRRATRMLLGSLLCASGCAQLASADPFPESGATSLGTSSGGAASGGAGSGGSGAAAGSGGGASGDTWSVPLVGPGIDSIRAIAVADDGSVLLTGIVHGGAKLGTVEVLATLQSDNVLVAKLDEKGHPLWAYGAGGIGSHIGHAIAATPDGGCVVAGEFTGELGFPPGGPLVASYPTGFVVKLDAAGQEEWKTDTPAGVYSSVRAVVVDGDVYVAAAVNGALDLGPACKTETSGTDVVILRLTEGGACVGLAPVALPGADMPTAAVLRDGQMFVVGSSEEMPTVQRPLLVRVNATFESTSFVVGGSGGRQLVHAATLVGDRWLVAGGNEGTSQGVVSNGASDVLVIDAPAALSPSGISAMGWGDGGAQTARAISQDASGRILLAGSFASILQFGGAVVTSADTDIDAFLTVFDGPDLEHAVAARQFGGPGNDSIVALAPHGAGVVVAGDFNATIDLGHGVYRAIAAPDSFVAKLLP